MRTLLLYFLSLLVVSGLAYFGGRLHERKQVPRAAETPMTKTPMLPATRPPKRTKQKPEAPEAIPENPAASPGALVAAAADLLGVTSVGQGSVLEVYRLVDQLQPQDIAAALEEISKLPHGKTRQSLAATVVARWAETDGAAAMSYALTQLTHANRPTAIAGALSSWSDKDPAGALSWFHDQVASDPDFELVLGAKPIYLLPTIFQGLVGEDISTAYAAFSRLATDEEKDQALDGIASASLTNQQTQHALELAAGTLGEAARAARLRLVNHWGERDPAAAAAWVSAVTDPTEKSVFAQSVASRWIAYEPTTAVPWLLENTMLSERPNIVELATSIWVQSDPNATAKWLSDLPKGKDSDLGVATLARNIVNIAPDTALGWAKDIDSDKLRRHTMIAVISQWRVREPERSVEALNQSGLPAEEIADYLRLTKPAR